MSIPEQLVSLEAFWNLKRAKRVLPRRIDFGPAALRPWLGNIGIVAVEYGDSGQAAPRFRITLSGTVLDEYRGFCVTGRYLDEVCRDRDQSLEHFRACISSRLPLLLRYDNSHNSAVYSTLAKLLLPVSDDGERVDRVIVAMYPCPTAAACNDIEPIQTQRLAG